MKNIKIYENIDFSLRLDILVKYVFIEAYEKNIYTDLAKTLYIKHMQAQNSFLEWDKKTKQSFLDSFYSLIDNIKKNGYQSKNIIEIWKNLSPLDGAHRIACWLFFRIEIPYYISKNQKWITWDIQWFQENNFSNSEILFLLWKYQEITWYDFFIQWPSCTSSSISWESLRYRVKENKNIISENLIDLYCFDTKNTKDIGILNKAEIIWTYWYYDIVFWDTFQKKSQLREVLYHNVSNKNITEDEKRFFTIHWYDSQWEKQYIKDIIFSPSYWRHLKLRGVSSQSDLQKLLPHLKNINTSEYCIVWSWALWIYNLNKVSDIDIIQKDHTNTWVVKMSPYIDILDYQYYKKISNFEIISHYSFIWRWYKFINLKLLSEVKAQWLRKKDIDQSQKIDLFLNTYIEKKSNIFQVIFKNISFLKTRIIISIIRLWIFMTKKLWIYKPVSYLWRKYILIRFR